MLENRDWLKEKLRGLIEEILLKQELMLVDLLFRQEGNDLILRILVDKPAGGITLHECALINRQISELLDAEDIIQQHYILEVSSPGLDRPLRNKADFSRCLKRRVRFFLLTPIAGKIELEGEILEVNEEFVQVDEAGVSLDIPLSSIRLAKQVI